MNDYEDIATAALHRDWQSCARIMFGLLFRCSRQDQLKIATEVLQTYADIWKTKHQDRPDVRSIPERLTGASLDIRPDFPDLPEDADAADAEYENALTGYYNGKFYDHLPERWTRNFASAIRSTVTAHQINCWMIKYPGSYQSWKVSLNFDCPTFLQDDSAADEAVSMWRFVENLLRRCHPGQGSCSVHLYEQWDATYLFEIAPIKVKVG